MDLSQLITDPHIPYQVVDVYLCPERVSDDMQMLCTGWKQVPPNVPSWITSQSPSTIFEYHYRDMICAYDKNNDSQRIYRKKLLRETFHGFLYGVSHIEEVLPVHRFPCTQDITHECETIRISHRINNRLFLHHDQEDDFHYIYVRYQHAPNVDLKKMQESLDTTLRRLTRSK